MQLTGWFQTRTPNQEAVDITLLGQLLAIFLTHATTIDNSRLLRRLLRHMIAQPFPNLSMYLLRLFRRGNLARPNRPNRLIRNHDLRPVFRLLGDGFQLCGDHFDGLVTLSLIQCFSTAQDDTQTSVERGFRLACNELNIPRIVSTPLQSLQLPTPWSIYPPFLFTPLLPPSPPNLIQTQKHIH
jgi:hypothetical protein